MVDTIGCIITNTATAINKFVIFKVSGRNAMVHTIGCFITNTETTINKFVIVKVPGRKAMVDTIGCITTNTTTATTSDSCVSMHGEPSALWITEVERVSKFRTFCTSKTTKLMRR